MPAPTESLDIDGGPGLGGAGLHLSPFNGVAAPLWRVDVRVTKARGIEPLMIFLLLFQKGDQPSHEHVRHHLCLRSELFRLKWHRLRILLLGLWERTTTDSRPRPGRLCRSAVIQIGRPHLRSRPCAWSNLDRQHCSSRNGPQVFDG